MFRTTGHVERFFFYQPRNGLTRAYPVLFGSVPEGIFTEESDIDVIIVFVHVVSYGKTRAKADVMNPHLSEEVGRKTLRRLYSYLQDRINRYVKELSSGPYFNQILHANVPILKSYPLFREKFKCDTDITVTYDGVFSTLWCILHMYRDNSKRRALDVKSIWLRIKQKLLNGRLTDVTSGGLSKYGYQVMMFNFLVEEHWLPKVNPTLVQRWASNDLPEALVSRQIPIYTVEDQRKLYSDAAAKIYSRCAAEDDNYQIKNVEDVTNLENRILLYFTDELGMTNFTLCDPINRKLSLLKKNFDRKRAFTILSQYKNN